MRAAAALLLAARISPFTPRGIARAGVGCRVGGLRGMAGAGGAKKPLAVGIVADVDELPAAVEAAFAKSSLSSSYSLELRPLSKDDGSSKDLEIVVGDPNKASAFLDALPKLKWFQSVWAGVNALTPVKRRDFTCTRLGGCFGPQMAEYVFGALMFEDWAALKKYQSEGKWEPGPFRKRRRLLGQTMGVLGVGDIASVIAQRGQAFGMKTMGFATTVRRVEGFDEVTADVSAVVNAADVIVSVLPSTPQTRGLLTRKMLSESGSDKVFINVGRGDVIDEADIVHALDQGWFRRAILDVFVEEPLPTASPLWKHPAVQVTPHIAAVTYPKESAELFVENLELWLSGKPMRFVADLDKGY
eukprot:TRINITY_DN111503_c0_g1_i1.p1 TRINITY_DN111503_c0_g1~~TRINITY_DN111503_c0_g1_i1.p1  ORF type:complete len:358 (+),score=94.34 TRINITY_DN111503_c0_g1_i1:55-1128(+)